MKESCKTGNNSGGGGKFRKGDPRINTKGRPPKNIAIPDELRRIGEQPHPEFPGMTRFQVFVDTVHRLAERGEMDAVRFVAERTEGKVKDTLALEGGGKLTIVEELVDGNSRPAS